MYRERYTKVQSTQYCCHVMVKHQKFVLTKFENLNFNTTAPLYTSALWTNTSELQLSGQGDDIEIEQAITQTIYLS